MDAIAIIAMGGKRVGVARDRGDVAAGSLRELDAPLVRAARAGDVRAFGQLIRRHDPRCRALAARVLHDRADLDDALQEAYCRAFAGLPAFRGDAAFGTWLYRIVYNACIDVHRGTARLVPVAEEEMAALIAPPDDPEELFGRRRALLDALATLTPEQRAAVVLVDQLGLDYLTAANVLGVAPGTIGSRLSSARATLRAALGEPDTDGEMT